MLSLFSRAPFQFSAGVNAIYAISQQHQMPFHWHPLHTPPLQWVKVSILFGEKTMHISGAENKVKSRKSGERAADRYRVK